MKDEGRTLEERRARTGAILVVGLVGLALLVVWAVILRRAPIEQDLVSRSAAILETAGIDATDLHFEGREGSVTIEAPLADSAGMIIRALEGVRSIEVTSAAPPATTTTTVAIATTTTITTTTTTTIPTPEARFTLTSLSNRVTLSGRLPVADAEAAVAAANQAFGGDRVTDAIVADDDTTSPAWTTGLPDAIALLRVVADPGLAIDGGTVTLAGDIASEQRRTDILAAFRGLGLDVADGLSIASPPEQATAAALEVSLNAALEDATILFESGSSAIVADGASQLDAIVDLLIAAPGARVEVAGHTDSEGPADGNLILSVERAESVMAHLIDRGVDPVQLTAVGYGQEMPIADNTTPEGRAANRRIEFTVEGSE